MRRIADRSGSFSIDGWGTAAADAYAPASLQQNRHRWPHAVRMDFAPPDADARQSVRHRHCAAERWLRAEAEFSAPLRAMRRLHLVLERELSFARFEFVEILRGMQRDFSSC